MKTVLVVDDEPALRAAVRAILGDEGYAVLEAQHGPAMLDLLARERADMVLLDVMMPGGDGREANREFRARADLPDVPVVMMSAAVRPDGLDPSIAAFLRKPFDLDHLLALVSGLIGRLMPTAPPRPRTARLDAPHLRGMPRHPLPRSMPRRALAGRAVVRYAPAVTRLCDQSDNSSRLRPRFARRSNVPKRAIPLRPRSSHA